MHFIIPSCSARQRADSHCDIDEDLAARSQAASAVSLGGVSVATRKMKNFHHRKLLRHTASDYSSFDMTALEVAENGLQVISPKTVSWNCEQSFTIKISVSFDIVT